MILRLIKWCMAWHACVLASRIALRDRDFVGEDPILAAELNRRMAQNRPPSDFHDEEQPVPTADTNSADFRRQGGKTMSTQWKWNPYWDLASYKKQETAPEGAAGGGSQSAVSSIWYEKGKPVVEHGFVEFKQDYNASQLYAMHLKVAEHAIYSTQQRLIDLEETIKPYKESRLMRMSYILRRADLWLSEMSDFYRYTHRYYKNYKPGNDWWEKPNTGDNPWWMANIRHIMYYQAILRRYIDLIYSVEYLRKMHAAEMARHKENNFDELFTNENTGGGDVGKLMG